MSNTIYPSRKRRLGDRYDGFKVRGIDPLFVMIPHIMKKRTESMVFFEEDIDIASLEKFCRKLRHETEMNDLALLHVIMAAAVRMIALHPCVNRFISGRKLYARNDISMAISIKRDMSIDGEETVIKPSFSPDATLQDVWKILREEVTASKSGTENSTDGAANILTILPGFLIKLVVYVCNCLDQIGKMPKFLNKLSPFHNSCYIVDNGSIGIGSVYHHLYDFVTCSVFLSMGRKENVNRLERDGSVSSVRIMNLKLAVDERICDGFYFATTIRHFRKLLKIRNSF